MMGKRKRGRPTSAHNVSVTPEFREQPDIEKLGRALLAIAVGNKKEEVFHGRDCYNLSRQQKGVP